MFSLLRFRWTCERSIWIAPPGTKFHPAAAPPRPQLNASLTIQQKLQGDNPTTELLRNQKSRKVKSRPGRSFTRRRGYSEACASHRPATSSRSFAMTALRQKRDQHLRGEAPEGRRSVGSLDCIDTAIWLGDNHQMGPVQLAFSSSSAPAWPSCKRCAKDWRIRNTALSRSL